MPIPAKEVIAAIVTPVLQEMEDQGLGLKARIKLLKAEFKAKSVEVVKFDGNIPEPEKGGNTPCLGWKRVGEDRDKTIFEVTRADMSMRQRARMDAHKLAGNYPAEEHNVYMPWIKEILERLDRVLC